MIIYQVRNPYARAALIALPLIILAIVYFTAIRPSNNEANQIIKSTTQQAQQQINQAKQGAPPAARKALDNASKLTACIQAAGTDVSKASACQAKYAG
jgi:predicted lipid-binding transport protein (Tim44 family)